MNNDSNVIEIRAHIDSMNADMLGTEIYNPLKYAINNFLNQGHVPLQIH